MKPQDIMNILNDIEYGWLDINNKTHKDVDSSFSNNYKLQSPEETLKNKIGVCWDQVELERYYFEKTNYEYKTYFIAHYDNKNCPTHTFLVYEDNNKYYWFEHSWKKYQGIHEYNSKNELLKDIKNKFIITELNNNYNELNLLLREYQKPKYGLTVQEFYKHCEQNEIIKVV